MDIRLRIHRQERCGSRLQIFLSLAQDPFQPREVRLQQFLNQRSCILQELRLQLFEFPSQFDQFDV